MSTANSSAYQSPIRAKEREGNRSRRSAREEGRPKKAQPASAPASGSNPLEAAQAVKALVDTYGAEQVKGLADLFGPRCRPGRRRLRLLPGVKKSTASLALVLPTFRGSCQGFNGFTGVAAVLAGAGASPGHQAMLLPQPDGGRGHAEDACGLADADRQEWLRERFGRQICLKRPMAFVRSSLLTLHPRTALS